MSFLLDHRVRRSGYCRSPGSRGRRRRVTSVAVAAMVMASVFGIGALGIGTAQARPHTPLPVTYDFLAGISAELAHPGGSLPGTNDYSCRPSAAHPRPVILVHGSGGGRQTNWATLAPVLVNAGYCVFAPTYGALGTVWPVSALGGLGPKPDSAWQIKEFIDHVRAATGSDQVDIVGHSLGTEIPTYWLKYLGGRGHVAHYVSLAPYWRQGPDDDDVRGETIAEFRARLGIAPPAHPACPECTPAPADLNFNQAVRLPTPYLPGVRYTNIVTRDDEIVTPYSAGILPGPPGTDVTNIVVQEGCPIDHADHLSIVANRRSAALVLNALDPAHPRPVPCVLVSPVTGG
ncbi:esterase/lipase family protein [Gordonia polyisoprenivorans]|uniref:esterase/lipase family protein n=1 Tax=Gordonia polyisoprenivorans TaxID=84595 RepID=UPI001AD7A61A|nr:alpha/beta fold hydrolase [Gordonia polyisoprenivorans]QTI68326.1 alpha/beta hydrolase [Gordonia polyisoprenivorans]